MTGANGRNAWIAILIAAVAAVALSGCREDEQDRIMMFEQGVYQGEPDNPLAPEQVDELRDRAKRQQY